MCIIHLMTVFIEGLLCGMRCSRHQRHVSGAVNKTEKVCFLVKLAFWSERAKGRKKVATGIKVSR